MPRQPLADRLRPTTLHDFVGQSHLIGKDGVIKKMIESNSISNLIFWGPPASGKTTLARIIGNVKGYQYYTLSAVMDGKDALKRVLASSKDSLFQSILFIDEIHRWNKAQQDALLPFVENGDIILIGATTENPSFSIINALLSRCQVVLFYPLTPEEITSQLISGYTYLTNKPASTDTIATLETLASMCDGDIRYGLNMLETILTHYSTITDETIVQASQKSMLYDRDGEEHYNVISAVHKSLRSGNATASVYWIARMLHGGEDPLYITRRLIRFASEDIGNSNPNALLLANQVHQTVQNIGMPECEVALVQLAQYLAESPKDNNAYIALQRAKADIKIHGSLPVPMNIRNGSTSLMKHLGYGKGYEYDHDLESKKSNQQLLPDKLKGSDYFAKETV